MALFLCRIQKKLQALQKILNALQNFLQCLQICAPCLGVELGAERIINGGA